jgi:nitric oxide reductase NorQ protein
LRGVEHDIVQAPQVGGAAPYYEPQGNEIAIFEAAYRKRLPVMLKGPTGCGKTRFVEHMAWRLDRPLVTVACHDDLSASDLTGRWLVRGGETVWQDGPLTLAARLGAICYLDEVVEARQDTIVVIPAPCGSMQFGAQAAGSGSTSTGAAIDGARSGAWRKKS